MKRTVHSTFRRLVVLSLATQGVTVAMAQRVVQGDHLPTLKQRHIPIPGQDERRPSAGPRAVIWSDDLSNASTWVIGNEPGTDPDVWVIGTEGPTGPFSESYGTIESTTAANGFALFDSDLACGGEQHTTLQMAAPVDLSSYPGAVLEFEQLFTRFRGDCFVDISTNGSDWTEVEVNAEVDVNESTDNPGLGQVNLTAYGGEATVWIRFRYFSTEEEHGSGGGCDYAWMIDDVSIVTLPDSEVILDYGFFSQTGDGEEYGRVPQDQWPSTLNVGAQVVNFGLADQTNVNVSIRGTNASSVEVFSTVQAVGSMSVTDTVLTDGEVGLSNPGAGLYTVEFEVSSDQITLDVDATNNMRTRTFEVTEDLYSLDNIGNHPEGLEDLEQVGTLSFVDNTENVKLLTMYHIRTPMVVTGLEIGLGPASEPGASIVVSILDTADVLSTPSVVNDPLMDSDPYIITAADVAAGKVGIPFFENITLQPNAYYAVASLFAEGEADVFVLDDITVPQPGLASAVWIPFDPENNQNLYGGNGTAWAVRLTSSPTVGMRDGPVDEVLGVFPNPTEDRISVSTDRGGRQDLELISAAGAVVLRTQFNQAIQLSLEGLAPGLYTLRLIDEGRTAVRTIARN